MFSDTTTARSEESSEGEGLLGHYYRLVEQLEEATAAAAAEEEKENRLLVDNGEVNPLRFTDMTNISSLPASSPSEKSAVIRLLENEDRLVQLLNPEEVDAVDNQVEAALPALTADQLVELVAVRSHLYAHPPNGQLLSKWQLHIVPQLANINAQQVADIFLALPHFRYFTPAHPLINLLLLKIQEEADQFTPGQLVDCLSSLANVVPRLPYPLPIDWISWCVKHMQQHQAALTHYQDLLVAEAFLVIHKSHKPFIMAAESGLSPQKEAEHAPKKQKQ